MRTYQIEAPDPLAVADAFGISLSDIGVRLGITRDYVRRLAKDVRQAQRVRRVVLELALERVRLMDMVS